MKCPVFLSQAPYKDSLFPNEEYAEFTDLRSQISSAVHALDFDIIATRFCLRVRRLIRSKFRPSIDERMFLVNVFLDLIKFEELQLSYIPALLSTISLLLRPLKMTDLSDPALKEFIIDWRMFYKIIVRHYFYKDYHSEYSKYRHPTVKKAVGAIFEFLTLAARFFSSESPDQVFSEILPKFNPDAGHNDNFLDPCGTDVLALLAIFLSPSRVTTRHLSIFCDVWMQLPRIRALDSAAFCFFGRVGYEQPSFNWNEVSIARIDKNSVKSNCFIETILNIAFNVICLPFPSSAMFSLDSSYELNEFSHWNDGDSRPLLSWAQRRVSPAVNVGLCIFNFLPYAIDQIEKLIQVIGSYLESGGDVNIQKEITSFFVEIVFDVILTLSRTRDCLPPELKIVEFDHVPFSSDRVTHSSRIGLDVFQRNTKFVLSLVDLLPRFINCVLPPLYCAVALKDQDFSTTASQAIACLAHLYPQKILGQVVEKTMFNCNICPINTTDLYANWLRLLPHCLPAIYLNPLACPCSIFDILELITPSICAICDYGLEALRVVYSILSTRSFLQPSKHHKSTEMRDRAIKAWAIKFIDLCFQLYVSTNSPRRSISGIIDEEIPKEYTIYYVDSTCSYMASLKPSHTNIVVYDFSSTLDYTVFEFIAQMPIEIIETVVYPKAVNYLRDNPVPQDSEHICLLFKHLLLRSPFVVGKQFIEWLVDKILKELSFECMENNSKCETIYSVNDLLEYYLEILTALASLPSEIQISDTYKSIWKSVLPKLENIAEPQTYAKFCCILSRLVISLTTYSVPMSMMNYSTENNHDIFNLKSKVQWNVPSPESIAFAKELVAYYSEKLQIEINDIICTFNRENNSPKFLPYALKNRWLRALSMLQCLISGTAAWKRTNDPKERYSQLRLVNNERRDLFFKLLIQTMDSIAMHFPTFEEALSLVCLTCLTILGNYGVGQNFLGSLITAKKQKSYVTKAFPGLKHLTRDVYSTCACIAHFQLLAQCAYMPHSAKQERPYIEKILKNLIAFSVSDLTDLRFAAHQAIELIIDLYQNMKSFIVLNTLPNLGLAKKDEKHILKGVFTILLFPKVTNTLLHTHLDLFLHELMQLFDRFTQPSSFLTSQYIANILTFVYFNQTIRLEEDVFKGQRILEMTREFVNKSYYEKYLEKRRNSIASKTETLCKLYKEFLYKLKAALLDPKNKDIRHECNANWLSFSITAFTLLLLIPTCAEMNEDLITVALELFTHERPAVSKIGLLMLQEIILFIKTNIKYKSNKKRLRIYLNEIEVKKIRRVGIETSTSKTPFIDSEYISWYCSNGTNVGYLQQTHDPENDEKGQVFSLLWKKYCDPIYLRKLLNAFRLSTLQTEDENSDEFEAYDEFYSSRSSFIEKIAKYARMRLVNNLLPIFTELLDIIEQDIALGVTPDLCDVSFIAENIAGIIRSIKSWGSSEINSMWKALLPCIKRAFDLSNNEIEPVWECMMHQILRRRDPRRFAPLLNLLFDDARLPCDGILRLLRISRLLFVFSSSGTRLLSTMQKFGKEIVYSRMYDENIEYRECVSQYIIAVAYAAYIPKYRNVNQLLEAKSVEFHRNTKHLSQSLEEIYQEFNKLPNNVIQAHFKHDPKLEAAKTLARAFKVILRRGRQPVIDIAKEIFITEELLAVLHKSQDLKVKKLVKSLDRDMAQLQTTKKCLELNICSLISKVNLDTEEQSWCQRILIIQAIIIQSFCNIAIIEDTLWQQILHALIERTKDSSLDVRVLAMKALSNLVRMAPQKTLPYLENLIKNTMPNCKSAVFKIHNGSDAEKTIAESVILCISAVILAHPHSIHSEFINVPDMLYRLSKYQDCGNYRISTIVRNTLREFRSKHAKSWEKDREKIDPELIDIMEDYLAAPSYLL